MIDRIDNDAERRPGPCCAKCKDYLGRCDPGDVTMCTKCGQWHVTDDHRTQGTTPGSAAALAIEKMDPYELLFAMERNAERMTYYAP
jgi:hypothetical protein